jgi:4-amino-4-deoxy-L-arabinose transferase-like glycosyltransferase
LYYTSAMKDAPVLPVSAYVLGIPQATGYPTYTVLTHLFTYLPVGDVAYRVNLASAVFGALAVVAVFFVGLALSSRIVAAAVGALAFGVSGLFWSQAVIAEVYTLNALFVALVVLVLLFWRERREDKYLLVTAFFVGLSMTHNMSSGLLLPAGFLFVLLVEPRKLVEWRLVLKSGALFLLGLVPYVFLPVRARMDPPLNVGDPSNWGRFWDLVSGAQYKNTMFVFGAEELPERLYMYLNDLFGQFQEVILMAGIAGAVYLLARDRAALALLAFLYLGWLFYALEFNIEDVYYYFIPTYLVLALFAAVGFGALSRAAEARTARFSAKIRATVLTMLSLLVLAVPLWGVGETYRSVDRSGDYEGRQIIEVVDRNTESGATIIQLRSPLYYATLVEGRRKDLKLLSYLEAQNNEEPQTKEEKDARINVAGRDGSLYALFPDEYYQQRRRFEEAGYRLIPVESGILYEVVPTGT